MAYKLPVKNSPANQNLQSQNHTQFFSLNPFTMAGTSRTVWNPYTVPVVDEELEEDEEWICRNDEYDSDDLSDETAKKSKWLRDFFELLDSLSIDQINDSTIILRCPACKNGVGATAWYKGFQGVLMHARDVRSKRVRLHQRFAEILREKLRNHGSKFSLLVSNTNEGVFSSEWKGLGLESDDQLIVWPPMVILHDTRSHKDEIGKWVGVANSELHDYLKQYDIRKVENAYGPGGHCGSLLIFDNSAMGYLEAERLHKKFLQESRGKYEWENHQGRTSSFGECLLYGYMATEEDMNLFNKHSKDKQKQKYEMKSYKAMIINPFKTLEEKVIRLEKKVLEGMEVNKILVEASDAIYRKHQLRGHEIEKIKKMATDQWKESKTEIDYLEKHYEDTIKKLSKDLEESKLQRKKLEEDKIVTDTCEATCRKLRLRGHEIEKFRKIANQCKMDGPEEHYEQAIIGVLKILIIKQADKKIKRNREHVISFDC